MFDGGGSKLFNVIKSVYADSSTCIRIKGGESERFRINSAVRQGCVMSPWLFNVYMDGVMKDVKIGMEGGEWDSWRMGKNRDCLASSMQVIWYYVVSRRRT